MDMNDTKASRAVLAVMIVAICACIALVSARIARAEGFETQGEPAQLINMRPGVCIYRASGEVYEVPPSPKHPTTCATVIWVTRA